MLCRYSWVILLGQEHRAIVEQVGIRVVSADKENFGNISAPRSTLDLDDDIERIGDVSLDGSKAKVRPATTMATSERPRAMVLVKACCSTLTAFSQGEVPCANAGAAMVTTAERSKNLAKYFTRTAFMTLSLSLSSFRMKGVLVGLGPGEDKRRRLRGTAVRAGLPDVFVRAHLGQRGPHNRVRAFPRPYARPSQPRMESAEL